MNENSNARLVGDESRPVASLGLLAAVSYRGPDDLGRVPALGCTAND